MGPECSLQEDLGPPSYIIAQEEILKVPGDTMSQNIPSPGSRTHPKRRKQYPWFEGSLGQKKDRRRKANILLLKIPKKLMDMERKA